MRAGVWQPAEGASRRTEGWLGGCQSSSALGMRGRMAGCVSVLAGCEGERCSNRKQGSARGALVDEELSGRMLTRRRKHLHNARFGAQSDLQRLELGCALLFI